MATPRWENQPPIDGLFCRLGAADGYGGEAPGAEYCHGEAGEPDAEFEPPRDKTRIVDFHLVPNGRFWVCYDDLCREGTYEEAVYLLAGRREIEG
ncbi:MAG: hypothetical protein H7841_08785 [Magnetospirillum sp. WYHS-4]